MSKTKKTTAEAVEAVVVEPVHEQPRRAPARRTSMGAIFWGFGFIVGGVLLLLDNLGVVTVRFGDLWQLWPVLIVGIGISLLSLRGWLAGLVSLLLVAALGTLVYLVAIDNPYYHTATDTQSQRTVVKSDTLTEKELDMTVRTGALGLDIASSATQQGYTAELRSRFLALNQSTNDGRDGVRYVTLETDSQDRWWQGIGTADSRLTLELTEQLPLRLRIETGASTIVGDLSSVQLKNLTVKAGASTIDLTFGATLTTQEVTLEAGASRVVLALPQTVGVRVETDSGLSHVDFAGIDKVSEGVYESASFASAEKLIIVHAKLGVSSFQIKRY